MRRAALVVASVATVVMATAVRADGEEPPATAELHAHSGHRERFDRCIVNAPIGVHDRSEATLADVQFFSAFSFRRDSPLRATRWALLMTRSQMESATVGSWM